ncbi:hypothetical protein WKK05_14155 [Nostoc sp. UHCC 0302]|uniref:hypothetical protein n=1 Tax=Nostoc sp. UHCC 0302 TaxID=3134896 RepID=UPI00311C9709
MALVQRSPLQHLQFHTHVPPPLPHAAFIRAMAAPTPKANATPLQRLDCLTTSNNSSMVLLFL